MLNQDTNVDPEINAPNAPLPTAPTGAGSVDPQLSIGANPDPQLSDQPDRTPQFTQEQAHTHAFGKLAKNLFTGNQTSYQRDAQGNMVETQTPMKPGALFRHILAGALLGAASGEGGSFAQGMGRGVSVGANYTQQQDTKNRMMAEQDFKMQMEAKKSAREDTDTDIKKQQLELQKSEQGDKHTLAQAQVAHANSQVLYNNTISQGLNFEQHMKSKSFFEVEKKLYESNGIQSITPKGVSETELHDVWQKRPDYNKYKWIVSDVKTGVDKDGHPTWEYMYKAYDLDKPVRIDKATLDLWKSVGMETAHPEIFKYKPGSEIPSNNYLAWEQEATDKFNKKIEMEKSSTDIAVKKQQINESTARAAKDWAEANRASKDYKKSELLDSGLAELSKAGGDIEKVDHKYWPVLSQAINAQYSEEQKGLGAAVTYAQNTNDNAPAQRITQRLEDLDTMRKTLLGRSPAKEAEAWTPKAGESTDIGSPAGIKAMSAVMQAKGFKTPEQAAIFLLGTGLWKNPHTKGAEVAPTTYEKPVGKVGYTIGEGTRTVNPHFIRDAFGKLLKASAITPGVGEGH